MKTAKFFSKLPSQVLNNFLKQLSLNIESRKGHRLYISAKTLVELIELKTESININDFRKVRSLPQLRKDLFEIKDLMLEFLAKSEIGQTPLLKKVLELKAIERYNIDVILDDVYGKSLAIRDNSTENYNTRLNSYLIKKHGFELNKSISVVAKTYKNQGSIQITDLHNDLKRLYLIESITLAIYQFVNLIVNRKPVDNNIIKLGVIGEEIAPDNLTLIYIKLYNLIISESSDFQNINGLISLIETTRNIILKDFRIIYDGLIHLLIHKAYSGLQKFDILQYRLRKLAVLQGLFNQSIDNSSYRNIILVACSAREFHWALKFSEEYKSKLPVEEQEIAYSFNKARIYTNMKQYEDVIMTLRDVEYKDITYNLNSKLMLMVSFYELDEYETLLSTIRAFKVFLRRRRNVSVARKANFTGFCDALYNIMLADENRDSKRIWRAKEIIDANPAIPNTAWLLEKIEALKL